MTDSPHEMDQACKAIGELILWANMIDDRLNKVIMGVFALPEHPLIEPIVAQLDPRPKAELLKTRMKLMPKKSDWRTRIEEWVKKAEKVNDHRNIVAHHRIEIVGNKVRLATPQLTKIMRSLDSTLTQKPDKGLPDIKKWVAEAAETYAAGQVIIDNVERFRTEALKRKEEAAKGKS